MSKFKELYNNTKKSFKKLEEKESFDPLLMKKLKEIEKEVDSHSHFEIINPMTLSKDNSIYFLKIKSLFDIGPNLERGKYKHPGETKEDSWIGKKAEFIFQLSKHEDLNDLIFVSFEPGGTEFEIEKDFNIKEWLDVQVEMLDLQLDESKSYEESETCEESEEELSEMSQKKEQVLDILNSIEGSIHSLSSINGQPFPFVLTNEAGEIEEQLWDSDLLKYIANTKEMVLNSNWED